MDSADVRSVASADATMTGRHAMRRANEPHPGKQPRRTVQRPGVLVVADDMTGANAVGAAFSGAGLRAVTVVSGQDEQAVGDLRSEFDVVVVNTDSRHVGADTAADRVATAVDRGWPAELVSKRIDTTLRGNIGTEVAAALKAVTALAGGRVVGLCLPAHPRAGRLTVNGRQLLHGTYIENTEIARDPRSPVRNSRLEDLLSRGTNLAVAHVDLSVVGGEGGGVPAALQDGVDQGADVIVCDALTEEHLDRLATAAAQVAAKNAHLRWIAIDPGPGSGALARAMHVRQPSKLGPLLAVSGSTSKLTRAQLKRLVSERDATVVPLVLTRASQPVPDVHATTTAALDALADTRGGQVVLLASVRTAGDVVDLGEDGGRVLCAALGRITRAVIQQAPVDGLFLTGGDVTAAVLEQLEARGLEAADEVLPLAVSGSIVGGPWSGLPVVTKGGLVGDAGTTVACLDALAWAAHRRRFSS